MTSDLSSALEVCINETRYTNRRLLYFTNMNQDDGSYQMSQLLLTNIRHQNEHLRLDVETLLTVC